MFKKAFTFALICALVFGAYFAAKIVTFDPSNEQFTLSEGLYDQVKASVVGYTTTDQIAPDYLEMLVYIEDKRFFSHWGFDLISIAKAAQRNFAAKEYEAGGSTLSQQLAKNLFYSREKTMERKLYELWTAIRIEQMFTKEQILEMYVNVIYYGEDAYGIADASATYFGKTPQDLSLQDAAMLVGLIPAPSVYNPVANPQLAKQRQQNVLINYENKNQ